MRFVMTQRDVDQGVRCDPSKCPASLTITRSNPQTAALVHSDLIYIMTDGKLKTHPTPANVAAFIDAFDDGLTPEPIEFDLPI